MQSFWAKLPKPFFVLAPMEDVTDAAFRRVIVKYGKPDDSDTPNHHNYVYAYDPPVTSTKNRPA